MKAVAVSLALCAVMMAYSVSVGASSESCKTCSQVANEFISSFPNLLTKIEWVKTACTMPSMEMRELCRFLFSKFVNQISSGIETSNASRLCAGISTCPVSLTKCAMWQFSMVGFGDLLTSSNGRKDSELLVNTMCKFYPPELRSNCTSGINNKSIDLLTDAYFLRFSKIVALFVLRFQAALEALLSLICHSLLPDMSRNCCR